MAITREQSPHGLVASIRWDDLKGWDKLKAPEQLVVRRKTQDLIEHIHAAGRNRLEIGKDLAELRDILEPRKMFEKYLSMEGLSIYNISRATAYRFIENHEVARTITPAPTAQARIALMRVGSKLTRALVATNPPPKTRDPKKIIEYIDALVEPKRKSAEELSDPDLITQELIMRYYTLFDRLPPHHKTRSSFFFRAAGMMATISGIASEVVVKPLHVPKDYKPGPKGRPRIHPINEEDEVS